MHNLAVKVASVSRVYNIPVKINTDITVTRQRKIKVNDSDKTSEL